jgi:CheY-specific phosphatase CheX
MTQSAKKTSPQGGGQSLFSQNVINAFCVGINDTLKTMAQVEVAFGKPSVEMQWQAFGDITGVVDFETADYKGSIYIHFQDKTLMKIYSLLLGEECESMGPEVLDCIGEISNMAYGVAKGKLDPLQMKFSMSIPKPTKTKDLIRLGQTPHLSIPFKILNEDCLLEVTLNKK